jgi:hypothetical protein
VPNYPVHPLQTRWNGTPGGTVTLCLTRALLLNRAGWSRVA